MPLKDFKLPSYTIPFLGGYFIFYGTISMTTYYQQFNVHIFDYADPSEVITYFLKDTYAIVRLVAICIGGIFIADIVLKKVIAQSDANLNSRIVAESEIELLQNSLDKFRDVVSKITAENKSEIVATEKEEIKQLLTDVKKSLRRQRIQVKMFPFKVFAPLIIWVLVVFLIMFLAWYLSGWNAFWNWSFYFQFFFPLTVAWVVLYRSGSPQYYLATYILVALVTSAHYDAIKLANKAKAGGKYGVEMKVGNEVITSDSTNFMIGKTSKYIFYYHSKKGLTTVYPTDKLEYITLPK
jgi:hypothetical protein